MITLNRRVSALKSSATMAAETRATELKAAGVDVISLAAGEPDFDTPEWIKEAARKALAAGQTKYTPSGGTRQLREAVAAKIRRDSALDYEATQVIVSAGGKQAECNIIATLFDEGDEVIIPTPAWVSFPAMVQLSGAEAKLVECSENDGFLLRPAALQRAITRRTRAIILNSPANPTGAVYRAEHLTELARVLVDADLCVMSDDVYEKIVYDSRAPHIFTLEPRLKTKGIVFNSMSKTYAMTGWRIGFAAGPKDVIAAAIRLQSQNSGNPNSIAQAAAVAALTGPEDDLTSMIGEFRKRRQYVVERMRSLSGFSLPNVPAGAFYVFPNVSALIGADSKKGRLTDGDAVAEMLLEEAHVALVGGNDFGAPHHVRISYATSMANLREAFDRIERVTRPLVRN